MNLIDIDLAVEPLTPKECNFIADKNYPFCLLGFQLKNAYDQSRLQFKKKYNIVDYVHFLPDSNATPLFFRGLSLKPNQKINSLFKQLELFNISLSELPTNKYKHVLSEYRLTCEDCFGSLQKGVYPIDGECVNLITSDIVDLNDLYANAFDTDVVPLFQSCGYFTVYILSNKSIYRTGTDKIILEFQKNN
jgi:hypothetical protein